MGLSMGKGIAYTPRPMAKQSPSKLREFRKARDLTQQQAGALVGVSRRTWLIWETGKGKPDDEWMLRLYVLTEGWLTPNDFYDLPPLRALRSVA